ncbi:MAG: carboxylesterase family protein [Gammaproteobacteria bacterium]|nr:carboxylesterase family protein [Gammaproteobacteria bacterium]
MKKLLLLALVAGVAGCGQSVPGQQEDRGVAVESSPPGYSAMNPPVVEVAGGKLRGFMDDGTFSFIGIQYATAARFEMPQKAGSWDGVRDAQTYGSICPVPEQTTVASDEFVWPHRYWPENENCQYLNLWTQHVDVGARRPVMVFLHGGGFTNGSSIEAVAYEGKNLSAFGDVVVVTLNHRLNVLGSLNLSAYGAEFEKAGNTGMADIETALRWIQENVEVFGGDPDNVTIFGQSGGSGKVVHLMHMPSAEGLFHKAIAQSSGRAGYLTAAESARIAEVILQKLGLDETQVDALRTLPYDELLEVATVALAQVREEVGRNISWRPVVDDSYIEAEYSDWSTEMPFIVGTNYSERFSTIAIGDGRKNEWSETETHNNLRERYGEDVDAIAAEFRALFPNKKAADAYFYAHNYRQTVWQSLETRLSQSTGPVYNYLFAYEAPVNGGTTPFHCAELIYVFHNVDLPELRIATGAAPSTYAMQDTVARAWVNFARTGNPSQDGLEWRPFTNEGRGTMVFDVESKFSAFDDRKMVAMMSE